jgi:ankyrin repeat protein
MDAPLLGLLGKESSTELKDYPGDLLFGMALSKATSGDKGFHGEVKYLIHEAAHATAASVRAMAIWKSIDAAIPSKDPGGNENISFPTMPEVAAMPNLYESNSGKAVRVSDEFRRRGGYNRESALTSVFTCAEIEQKIIAATYSDNAILPVDLTIERKPGQRFSGPVRAEDSLLHLAAAFGVCEAITRLISNKHSNPVLDARNTQDETPLYKACMAGQYEAARELLRLGADSSLQVGRTKVTCLHWLFVFQPSRMKEIARALLLSGVSVDARVAPVISLRGQDTMVFEETTHYPFHWPMGTALHWAAHMESIEAVGHLIDHGAYVDEVDEVYVSDAQQSPALKTKKDQSQTALSMAMYRGSSLMVKYLLGRGAEPCRADGEGRTPLHMLAGDCWMQNRLFSIPLNIHQWCFHGNFEACVKALKTCIDAAKDKGASLDSGRKHQNLTPLMDAVQSKNVCAVIALLKAGANANICEDWSKNLPIHIWLTIEPDTLAYPEGYFVALEELLNNTVDITRSRTAVTNLVLDNHSPSWKKKLLTLRDSKHHIDINMQDDSGMSLLMTWISLKIPDLNYLEGVMWLLTNGADITIKDRFGRDFLFYAAENWEIGDEDCLGLLKLYTNHHAIIPQGTLLNGSKDDESGKTVLMAMCKNCYIQSAQFAIQNGIDVNAFDKDGRTALDVALESGNTMRLALLSGFMIHHADGRRQLPKESDDISEVDWYRAGFGDKHHESQSSHNSAAFIKARYMTFPRLRTLLVEAGAKTGKQLGQRTIAPDIKQSERDFVVESGVENFDPEQQPFYDLWKEAYRYDDTTEEEDAIRRREREGWSM